LDGNSTHAVEKQKNYPLLFEMLRSFVALANNLNLSHTVNELSSTRQTVRRHIQQLEEIKGGDLFQVVDRQYFLTPLGDSVLPEAQDLLARALGWAHGNSSLINGLQYINYQAPNGWSLYQQQQPIGRVYSASSDMLRKSLSAWVESGGELEHPAMEAVRPYLMVFRRADDGWLCVELGEDSSFVSWYGWAKARSSIGRDLGAMPGGVNFGRLVNLAYIEVETNQSLRLDHTYTQVAREPDGPLIPICYERLLMASQFPDGSFAMVSTVRRTYDVDVKGVTDEMLRGMPKDLLM